MMTTRVKTFGKALHGVRIFNSILCPNVAGVHDINHEKLIY